VEEKEPQGGDVYAIKIFPCGGTSTYSLIVSKVSSAFLTCSFLSSYLFSWMLQLE
jgi:hypothetical protein